MTQAREQADPYRAAGVDIDAGAELVKRIAALAGATKRPGVLGQLGGFAAIFDPAALGMRDPLLLATTDGVGTKLLLAAEQSLLEGLGRDLVAMCVNDLVVQAAQPLFFLDYFATGRLDVGAAATIIGGIAEGCREAGCALVGGETAEMPGLYGPGHFDLAGFAVGAVERGSLLPRGDVQPGDRLIGVGSSGLHSNGFSLVRRIVQQARLDLTADLPALPGRTLGEALLTPTRIYARAALAAAATGGVKAMAHITGGGLVENIPRALPAGFLARLDAGRWPLPPVMAFLAQHGHLAARDLARVFNAGLGLVAVVAPDRVTEVVAVLRDEGEAAVEVGEILAIEGPARVEITGAEAAWSCG